MSRSYARTGDRAAPFSADSNKRTAGAYAENTLKLWGGRTVVALGGRFDHITTQTVETPLKTNFTPSESDFGVFNPSVGIKHELREEPARALRSRARVHSGRSADADGLYDDHRRRSHADQPGQSRSEARAQHVLRRRRGVDFPRYSPRRHGLPNRRQGSLHLERGDQQPTAARSDRLSVANGLDAHISGLELEADHRVTSRLGVFANTTHYFNRRND